MAEERPGAPMSRSLGMSCGRFLPSEDRPPSAPTASGSEHVLIRQILRYPGEIGCGIRNEHVVGLAAVDGIAQAPASHGLAAALRGLAIQTGVDADRLVADNLPGSTGYSPFRMWISVPQIVVNVTRIRASRGLTFGMGRS